MTSDAAPRRDLTADVLGVHPFALNAFYGDERIRAYVADAVGVIAGPGIQVLTPAAELELSGTDRLGSAALHPLAVRLSTDLPYLLNVACQADPEKFRQRMDKLAAAAGVAPPGADESRLLDALKRAVDSARGIAPGVIMRAAVAYLAQPITDEADAYGTLLHHVNQALTNPGANPRCPRAYPPIAAVGDIGPGGVELWWIKEGSATIVLQVRVDLKDGRPPVRFVLNVAKDTTRAAGELRQVHADFTEFFRTDSRHVMEPYGCASVEVRTWRGPDRVAVLAAEWFEGHELHVYEGSSQLFVWMDQRMDRDHPIAPEASHRIWEQTVWIRARYTRAGPDGLVPITTHVNAGDYIFRQKPDGEWDVLLIWARRPLPSLDAGDALVLDGMLSGVNVFGADVGRTVWWDEPGRALAALRAGLREAGLTDVQVDDLLRHALDGPFREFRDNPERIPHSSMFRTADAAELRGVLQRARNALEAELRSRQPG